MPIVYRVNLGGIRRRGGKQVPDCRAYDGHALYGVPTAVLRPDLARRGVFGEDESPDRSTPRDVQQCRIAALMRCYVVRREPNRAPPTVVMDGEIVQPQVRAVVRLFDDERGRQRPIPALARDVVYAIPREEDLARQQAGSPLSPADAGRDHRAVLITVPREEMGPQALPQGVGDTHRPRPAHCDRIHSSTFASLRAAVSVPTAQWFERREIWVAGRPRHETFWNACPRGSPSLRSRLPSTKCG